ncbi:hypothetical protein Bca4012_064901 [Brassica carinata]
MQTNSFCCFVDGSWTSSFQKAGIGWALDNRDCKLLVQGTAAMDPINSALETGAEALRVAVVQMKRLGFNKVIFCGDSSMLYNCLSNSKKKGLSRKINSCITRHTLMTS